MENGTMVNPNNMVQSPFVFGEEVTAIKNDDHSGQVERDNEILETKVKNVATELKGLGKGNLKRKAAIMIMLKQDCPEIDITKFVEQYCDTSNHFEYMENFDVANEVENHLSLKSIGKGIKKGIKSVGKVGKVVGQLATSKIGSMAIGAITSVVGTPAAGAAVVAALGTAKKVADKAKSLNLPLKEVQKIVRQPEKATAVQLQAIAPDNAMQETLAPIVPLEKSMKEMLNAKGVTTTNKTTIEDLASMFHDKIVFGKDSFDTSWYKGDAMSYAPSHHFDQNHLDFSKAGQIVNDIVGFFQKAKANPETPTEEKAAIDVVKLEKQLASDEQKTIAQKVENAQIIEQGFSTNTIVMFGAAALLLYFFMRK